MLLLLRRRENGSAHHHGEENKGNAEPIMQTRKMQRCQVMLMLYHFDPVIPLFSYFALRFHSSCYEPGIWIASAFGLQLVRTPKITLEAMYL
jgi:hypothetical protein